ncbi:MAG: hypothetical protein Q9180_004791, partial [Flavoplaca navasiana]
KPNYYQPTITRLPSLIALFLLTLALIGLTEFAVRRFPALDAEGIVQTIHEKQQRHQPRLRLARHAQPLPQLEESSNVPAIPNTAPNSFPSGIDQHLSELGAAPISAFLPNSDETIDSVTSLLSTPPPSTYLPSDVVTTVDKDSLPSAHLPEISGGTVTVAMAPPTAFLPVEPAPTSVVLPDAQVPPDGTTLVVIRPASSTTPSVPPEENTAVEIRPASSTTLSVSPDGTTLVEMRPASSTTPSVPPEETTAVKIRPASTASMVYIPPGREATGAVLPGAQTAPDGNAAVEIRPATTASLVYIPPGRETTGAVLPGTQTPPDGNAAVEIRPATTASLVYIPPGRETTGAVLPGAQTPPDGNAAVETRPATVNAALTPGVAAARFPVPGSQTAGPQNGGPVVAGFQAPGSKNFGGDLGQSSVQFAGSAQTPDPQTGEVSGATYSVGSSGAVINGKTIDHTIPTTVTVPSSKVVVVDPSGAVAIQDVPDRSPPGSAQTPDPQTGEVNGVIYSVGPSGAIVNGKTIDYTTPTTVSVASSKVVVVGHSGDVAIQDVPDQSTPPQPRKSVTKREYLIGAFLPTVLAVLFSIPWYILFTAVQDMEPFYQLAHPQGALARDSICLNYKAYVNVVTTLKAGLRGHFVVLWAGVCSIAVLALAPLASETVFIGFVGEGRCTATSSRDACHPQLSVYPVAARAVQGILGLVAVLTICIAITISRRNSGVYANPLSIAGIATLFQNQTLIDEFRQLDPDGFDSERLEAQLQDNRYRLGHFQHRGGSMDYGITRYTEASFYSNDTDFNSQYSYTTDPKKNRKYTSVPVTPVEAEPTQPRKPKTDYFLHSTTMVVFAVFVSGLLTLVVYYNQTGGDTGFERFMDSQTFGVAFMFSAVGVMLKMYWGVVDDDLRATNPHRLLLLASSSSSASAAARQSILASPPSNPFAGVVYSLHRMTWLPGWLSIVAVLTEPLIVALANIPFNPGTAYVAYLVSTYITIGVLSFMLLGLFGVLGRQKVNGVLVRRGIEAARERTVGRVMGLVCGSCMLSEFQGLAELDEKSRDEVVQGWGMGYRMGRLVGVDGVERWGVDEDIFVEAGGD